MKSLSSNRSPIATVVPLFASLSRPLIPPARPPFRLRAVTCASTAQPSATHAAMSKKILITGATDGIGLEAAKLLAAKGHTLLLHGRSAGKLQSAVSAVSAAASSDAAAPESFLADLSDMGEVDALAADVLARHGDDGLDVLINNAGVLNRSVLKAKFPPAADLHLVVNALAPYRLTRLLEGAMCRRPGSRVVNLSSAAQQPVRMDSMTGTGPPVAPGMGAYAMSKLAITMWSNAVAAEYATVDKSGSPGRVVVAVNPGSLLATKMVKEGFGMAGNNIMIGANILVRAAVGDDFKDASGKYFDNDARMFSSPHPHAMNDGKNTAVVKAFDDIIAQLESK